MNTVKTLLIVDDSLVSRHILRTLLSPLRPDWRILEAKDSESALALAATETPDYVTLDFSMPGMNGLELAALMTEKFPGMKMVLLTSNIQLPIRQRAAELGIPFIAKPITKDSCAKILELLND